MRNVRLLLALLLACCTCAAHALATPQARAGVLDLRGWNFERDGVAVLAGEWSLAWGRFEVAPAPGAAAGGSVAVPGAWNDAAVPGKPPGEAFGHGTYGLTILCDDGVRLALKLPVQHSALRVFVNERPVAAQGVPGASAATARAAFVQQVVPLEGLSCPLRLAVQVSNHDMRRGGLLRQIELGTTRQVLERRERGLARDLVTIGGIGVLCLLALIFFLWRPRERAPLWFCLYGLTSVLLAGISGERVLQPLLTPLPWDHALKLMFLCFAGGTAAFPALIRALYPAVFSRRVLLVLVVPVALLALLVAATPARVFTQTVPVQLAWSALIGAIAVGVLVCAALQGRRDAWLMLVGVSALIGASVHDIVEISSQVSNKWVPYGLFVFALAPAILLARRFARALEAEELLAVEQRQQVDLLVNATKAGILDTDATAGRTTYSERLKEMLGYARDADSARWPRFIDLVHPEDRARIHDSVRRQLRDLSVKGGVRRWGDSPDFRVGRADGSHIWVSGEGISITGDDGRTLRYICSFIDVSERKRQELELARERERLTLLLRATKAGFMDWDARNNTQQFSGRFKEMLGYAHDADSGSWPSLFDLMHPDDREPMREAFREMLRRGVAAEERMHGPLEYRLRKVDGSYIWVRGEGIAQLDADGRTERFLTSYIDITPLREMNLALEDSVRLREEVDRMSRHDLKTPLNSIIGFSRVLRDSGRLSPDDQRLAAFIEQAGYRLLGLVNLSLDMLRMEQGTYQFSPVAVDVAETLRKVAHDLKPFAAPRSVAIAIEGPRLWARAEVLLCYSMLANLVKNAIEASPEGGTVRIAVEAEGASGVRVVVHNAGTVPEAMRARFFQKYATAGKSGGSGLGSYSARLMARVQHGDITMQSSAAAGTTLSVSLRLASEADRVATAAPEQAAIAAPADLPPVSVLVVDDDDYSREYIRGQLPRAARVAEAGNGREALERASASPPDLILMDLDMPVMGGLEAAAKWRAQEQSSRLARRPMVAMSSHDGTEIRERALAAGFDLYLEKPVPPDALRRALQSLLGRLGPADPVPVNAMLRDALPGFLESRRKILDDLDHALSAQDAGAARALAHKLAGSFALYGFRWAAGHGRLIERRAGEGTLEGLAAEVVALRRHLDEVHVEIIE